MISAPQAVRNLHGPGELELHWSDGLQVVSHVQLRGVCPCSQCRAAKLRGGIVLVRDDVRVARIEMQGYGVQLVFSDGHDRGIYPWAFLRGLG